MPFHVVTLDHAHTCLRARETNDGVFLEVKACLGFNIERSSCC